MNVSLTRELEDFVNGLVQSGMYFSASEVVRYGLRLVKEQESLKVAKLNELRAEIMLGVEDLRAGRSQTFYSGDEVYEEIVKRGREKLAKKRNGK